MKRVLYTLWQCSWGLPQTLAGAVLFLLHRRDRHFAYHGAVVTRWRRSSSVALGLFVFVADAPRYRRLREGCTPEALFARLLVHEYGHTLQSLLLGPLFLPVIGLPSAVWGSWPALRQRRRQCGVPYCAFFTEKWANALGKSVTGQPSLGQLVLD